MKENPTPIPSKSQWILTKESTEDALREYFAYILSLAESGEQFPANLENVWRICYTYKSDAMAALRRDFVEGYDYQVLRQSPQNPQGGRPVDEYYFSQSCLEFFIARKVREVFEVYREVFHKTYQKAKQAANAVVKAEPQQSSFVPVTPEHLRNEYTAISLMREVCYLSEADVAVQVNEINAKYGLTPRMKYVPVNGTLRSASELLDMFNIGIKARAFNQLLLKKGYLKEVPRPTSNGGTKTFKELTEKAKAYGENKRSPYNAREKQPLYYEETFSDFCNVLGIESNLETAQPTLFPTND